MEKQYFLAGDIGGTKTLLALYSREKGPLHPLHEKSYVSGSYPGLTAIIEDFFSHTGISAQTACFGVAGPVRNCRAVITKLPWQPDSRTLKTTHGFSTAILINDLVANGFAIPHLEKQDLFTINEGIAIDKGAIGLIAPGTGLGEAIFTWSGKEYIALASEGGHSDFAPLSELEIELLRFLNKKYEHISYDRICSGRGLPDIYEFLKSLGYLKESDWLVNQLSAAADPTPVIVNAALDTQNPCGICIKTLRMFTSILGAEAGNLALKGLTTGGIYLGGGIPPRIVSNLEDQTFMKSFISKGRMSYLLQDIPVKVILNPKAALIGAASFGLGYRFENIK